VSPPANPLSLSLLRKKRVLIPAHEPLGSNQANASRLGVNQTAHSLFEHLLLASRKKIYKIQLALLPLFLLMSSKRKTDASEGERPQEKRRKNKPRNTTSPQHWAENVFKAFETKLEANRTSKGKPYFNEVPSLEPTRDAPPLFSMLDQQ